MAPKFTKDDFFRKQERQGVALTYDDVRLKTSYSDVMPDDASITSFFSRNIPLKIPIVSAAMDTVTESDMAIAMAKLGGLGIIHKNLSVKKQRDEVRKTKFSLNGLIDDPICVAQNMTIEQLLNMRKERDHKFESFPVLDNNKKLVGVITGSDVRYCPDYSRKIKEVMTKNPIVSHRGVSKKAAYQLMQTRKKNVLPLVDDNGMVIGMYTFNDLDRIFKGHSSMQNVDKKGQLLVGAAIGTGDEGLERAEALKKYADVVVIDTAHGDTKRVIATLRELKKNYDFDVVAGNVAEGTSALTLAKAGADGVKVGIGPGSICTTRIIAGVGCPQITAISNSERFTRKYKTLLIADGGVGQSGDIPIGIGAGAHSVMLGSLLAGTDEAPGDIIFFEGAQWKSYRGMGSLGAMEENAESRARYQQSGKGRLIPEGVEGLVQYKGPVGAVIANYVGGLRRGMGYVGAKNIEQMRRKADFHRLTDAGRRESHPHDIKVTKEPPNYKIKR